MSMTPWTHVKYRSIWQVLLASALILSSEVAHVSKSRLVEVTLEQLITESKHIVVVERDSPFTVTEVVPIVEAGKEYPPYQRMVYRYRVLESLRGILKKGAAIEVLSANERQDIHVHRLFVVENVSKSVFDRRYQPRATIAENEPYILFLTTLSEHEQDKRYRFMTGDSYEGMGMRDDIKRRLGADAGT